MIPRLANRLSSVQTRRILPHRVAQPHAWTTHLPLIPRPRLIAFYSSLETSRPEAQHLRQEIDDFFAGYGSETPNPLPPPPALPHTASPSPFATDFHPWLRPSDRIAEDVDVDVNEPPVPLEPPPFVSSIRIVQRLLEEHEFLNSQQIWGIATDGCKPILRAAHVIQPDGRIKMKKVATMREERRAWIPPATAPLPDHPFQSMNFLKNTVLASLESQGLVHKAQRGRPLATDAERDEAIRQATKETRRAERNAVKNFKPVPAPKEPATTISEYGWRLGPDARSIQAGDAEASWGRDAGRWARAERMEEQFYRNKFRDMEATAERQRARRAAYKREKERFKAVKLEDERLGRSADVKREKMRLDALEKIQNYARITGEDVSDWYEELGQGPVEDVAELKKLMAREYGEMKRAKVLRR